MIVKKLEDIIGSDDEIKSDNWESRRFLLAKDKMGFSLNDTIIKAGTETHIWYQNHLEAVYCIEGNGEIETVKDGKVYPIEAGTMYALDKNDEHYLRGVTNDLRIVCVLYPHIIRYIHHDNTQL